ncbi:hypothetical protein BIZ37_13420 [Photobacterium sp. BZF1]|uniref:WlaTC/HtrL family glycosyltransferase n=1 Tax=Photobacterium sp. BZF1 TaxID=1904457 RepID=UPI001653BF45|nr:WlaTC/HtrL family glycosyltransferase [Photobacterium sp. BZF1]MBC7003560.1 hypothetical protein [Photobacterium sp. BZF1]
MNNTSRQSMDRVYISGYWTVGTNVKKAKSVYLFGIERTFQLLKNSNLIFFTDDDEILEVVTGLSKKWNIKLKIIKKNIHDLPAQQYIDSVICAAERMYSSPIPIDYKKSMEKGVIHYYRDLKHAGRENYQKLLLIWLSKIFLVNEIIRSDIILNEEYKLYCWIDCSAERFSFVRSNWNFTKQSLPMNKLSHYTSGSLSYMGVSIPISASFLAGNPIVWQEIEELFIQELKDINNDNYAHDEETLLTNIILNKPELFHTIGDVHEVKINKLLSNLVSSTMKKVVYYRSKIKHM